MYFKVELKTMVRIEEILVRFCLPYEFPGLSEDKEPSHLLESISFWPLGNLDILTASTFNWVMSSENEILTMTSIAFYSFLLQSASD